MSDEREVKLPPWAVKVLFAAGAYLVLEIYTSTRASEKAIPVLTQQFADVKEEVSLMRGELKATNETIRRLEEKDR